MKKNKFIYLLTASLICLFSFSFITKDENNFVQYVDPFIGSGGHGHVFVGANVPFGGVQVGPLS